LSKEIYLSELGFINCFHSNPRGNIMHYLLSQVKDHRKRTTARFYFSPKYFIMYQTFLAGLFLLVNLSTSFASPDGDLLLISPGARATGMGEVQTALVDPMAGHFNAGSMGVFSLDHGFSFSRSSVDWRHSYLNDHDFHLDHAQLFTGRRLIKKTEDNPFELSGGLDLTRTFEDLGEFEQRGEFGEILGTYDWWERNYSAGLSLGFRRIIEIGIGYKLNYLTSEHEPEYKANNSQNRISYDWGVLFRLPLSKIFEQNNPIIPMFFDPFQFDIIPSYGYSRSNLGGTDKDPLVEIYRRGYAVEFRFDLPDISLLSFIYAQDIDKNRYNPRHMAWGDEHSGIGREISFFDAFIFRWGEYHYYSETTEGYTIQSRGLMKIIYEGSKRSEWAQGDLYKFVMNRMNFRYSHSSRELGYDSPVVDFDWIEFGISF